MTNCSTDTDSFVYEIKTKNFYTDLKNDLSRFDTSDYPSDNIFQIPQVNKKIPGYFKDELNSQIITEFVGLRSKMYCIKAGEISFNENNNLNKIEGYDKIKRAKGVKRYVLNNQISFENYTDCVFNKSIIMINQNSIRSKLHCVYSITQKKNALNAFDNKRFICDGNIKTLPWGHYKIV